MGMQFQRIAHCLAAVAAMGMLATGCAHMGHHHGKDKKEKHEHKSQMNTGSVEKSAEPSAEMAKPAATPAKNPEAGKVKTVMDKLKLEEGPQADSVRASLQAFYEKLRVWHTVHDATLTDLWKQFNDAGNKKDIPLREKVTTQIDEEYTSIWPAHDELVTRLRADLTPEQVEVAKDGMTQGKVMFTYNNYLKMIPEFNERQKEYILGQMKEAREKGMNTTKTRELSAFFEVHKTRVEQYIDAEGYGYRKRYKQWVASLKKATPAKTTGTIPAKPEKKTTTPKKSAEAAK